MSSMGDLGAILVPLGATCGVSWSLLGPSWGYLERSWVVLGPSWGDVVPVGEGKNISFPHVFSMFFANPISARKIAMFGHLGAVLGRLGSLLGRLGTVLGRSWAVFGPSWECLGRS